MILYTGKDLFFSIFGKDVKEILKKLFIEKRNQFSHEFTYFILLDEKISGMVLSYSYDEKSKIDLNTGYLLIKIMNLNFFKNFPKFIKIF